MPCDRNVKLPGVGNGGLGSGQTRDGHAEGGTGHIVQADIVAEHDRGGVAAVLAADAKVKGGVRGAAPAGGVGNQSAYAMLVQTGEGIALENLLLIIGVQELARIIPAEAEDQLGRWSRRRRNRSEGRCRRRSWRPVGSRSCCLPDSSNPCPKPG